MPSIGKSGSSKISSKNVVKKINLGTLESQHKKQVDNFEKKRKELPSLRKKLSSLQNKLASLQNQNTESLNAQRKIDEIQQEVQRLDTLIKAIENKHDKLDYYMNVGPLLFQYFDERNDIGSSRPNYKRRRRKNGISNFLQKNQKTNSGETGGSFVRSETPQKATPFEMLDEYLSRTDPNWVKKSQNNDAYTKESEHFCLDCECLKILLHKESKVVCPKCGVQETIIIESDIPSYKDPPPEMNYFEYKRINHFNELLVQFQAKESTHIPKEVYDMIRNELKKERKTLKDLNYNRVKRYLKKYSKRGYNHYYDHTFHIINKMNGNKPLSMTPEMEENLRYLFLQIQKPFEKFCPPGRKNFISYNFVFYKFCEMLGYTEFLKYFPLLKSKEKLYQQEKIWEKICDDIGW